MPKVPLARSCRNKELEEDCCLPVDSNGLGGWCSSVSSVQGPVCALWLKECVQEE